METYHSSKNGIWWMKDQSVCFSFAAHFGDFDTTLNCEANTH